jgi:hypothetical protein
MFGREEKSEKKWNEKYYFKNIIFFLLFGRLIRRECNDMERLFPCLEV